MKIEQSALVNPSFRRTLPVEANIHPAVNPSQFNQANQALRRASPMFGHAQQKYSRSVHFRFVAAQDFLIRHSMPRTPRFNGSADDMLAYSTGLVGRK
jgi:hypothetical protein